MRIGENEIGVFLAERFSETANVVGEGSFLNSKIFEVILQGDARLPLDRVEEVALALGCDARQLFRLAMRQFYDEESICLFERMLGKPITNEERMWLNVIRSAADGPVAEPSAMARRLVRALVNASA
ncbi:hypothetical protein ACU8OG_02575 [Rhizobium leguminosarum]